MMEQGLLSTIFGWLSSLCVSGGIIYLIVEKILNRKRDREDVKRMQVETVKGAVEYGIPMIELYKEIDKIVESKTRPIQDKLDIALKRIEEIEPNYCCRENCPDRIKKEE